MKNKSKKGILIAILLLAVGFAAVSTTLIINGNIRLGTDSENFEKNVIFTDAKLEYSDSNKTNLTGTAGKALIIENGKKISFTTDVLTELNEYVTLTYEISNRSQYAADVKDIKCTVKNAADVDVTNSVVVNKTEDYIKLDSSDVSGVIQKNGVKPNNTLKITMIKSYVGNESSTETQYHVSCEIKADGVSAS